jgi:phage shock protein E
MPIKVRSVFFLLLSSLLLLSCSSTMLMDANTPAANSDTVWIDVRTVEEYQEDHIDGDRNMPVQGLNAATLRSQLNLPVNTDIRLYCVSGVRAGRAQAIFEEAGFTNVTNAGGISNVRDARKLNRSSPVSGGISIF